MSNTSDKICYFLCTGELGVVHHYIGIM